MSAVARRTRVRAKTTPKAPAKPRATTPPRIAIAVKRLAEALELPDEVSQCSALHAQLAKVPRSKIAATATAVLAHTPSGRVIARAYLTTLASPGDEPVAAADAIVRYCAAIDRGRKAMRPVFVATWRRAADPRAVEEAYKNFAREIVDDPALLAIGVEAARRLANHSAVADRTARLDRATRLAPLVKALAGKGTARARTKLEAASAEDRQHIRGRILEAPRDYPVELAVGALVATVDDPNVPDLSLSAAVAAMREHGLEAVVATWHRRVASGDDALILRLLGLFEWTGLFASEVLQLEPYIRALHPVGHRPDVFAQVDGALTSENPIVREAVLDLWLAHPEGQRAFVDRQINALVRATITIAEDGRDTPDRRAANHALCEAIHPGARKALMDAIESSRTKRNDKLRTSLYLGLSRLSDPTIVPFLVERLFVEREQHEALTDALAKKLDPSVHRSVMATFAGRAKDANVVHAITLYAEILVEKRRSLRLLLDLARAIVSVVPVTRDDGRRLRYVFEQAAAGALVLKTLDDARSFIAHAKQLPEPPFSDLRGVARGVWTPSPFAEDAVEARFAALDSGVLEQDATARRSSSARAVDDAQLASLAGGPVASRLLDDRENSVVWFFDELGELFVYNGFAIGPPTFPVTGDHIIGMSDAELAAFVGGKTMIDERATFVDPELTKVREVIRIGDRILVFDSTSGLMRALGIKVPGYVAARNAFARFAASPPSGLRRIDSWSPKGIAICRVYRSPSGATARFAVIRGTLDGDVAAGFPPLEREHSDATAAAKALQAWEGKLFGAGGSLVAIALSRPATA